MRRFQRSVRGRRAQEVNLVALRCRLRSEFLEELGAGDPLHAYSPLPRERKFGLPFLRRDFPITDSMPLQIP